MGTDKRARQKAGRQLRIEAAMEAKKKAESRALMIRIAIAGGLAVLILVAVIAFTRSDDTTVDTAAGASTTIPASLPPGTNPDGTPVTDAFATPPGTNPDGSPITTVPAASPVTLPAGASIPAGTATPCPAADGSSARTTSFGEAPPVCIDPAKTYTAKIVTDKGDVVIALDAKAAPKTVNNFVVLARYHFYDNVAFHRVLRGFMAQTGDPTGQPAGTGDPGYKVDDELPKDPYKPGSVAMANSGPNTNGGQFFIYVGPNPLAQNYSLFGQVTEGLDTTVKAIIDGGADADGAPNSNPSTITSVTITEV